MYEEMANILHEMAKEIGIPKIKDATNDAYVNKRYIEKVSQFLELQAKNNGQYSISEEYDWWGLLDFLKKDAINIIRKYISEDENERARALRKLYSVAYDRAKANTDESREKVNFIVTNSIKIFKEIIFDSISFDNKAMATRIEQSLDGEFKNISNKVEALEDKVIKSSLLSLEGIVQMKSNKDFNGIEEIVKNTRYCLDIGHELFPDYGVGFHRG